MFGGSVSSDSDGAKVVRSQGDYSNDLMLLDTGRMRWSKLEGEGVPPKPRADTAMVYDPEGKRLVVFGGFANRWYSDVHAMNVARYASATPPCLVVFFFVCLFGSNRSMCVCMCVCACSIARGVPCSLLSVPALCDRSVIGPPYAITGIEPGIGPVTGNTPLIIHGLGFDEGQAATVRFTLGKKFVDALGTCTSATTIAVNAPGFEHIGPGKVVVRVSLRGQQPTITWEEYTFFDVTEPANCLAFGPGVLNGCAPGVPVEFYVQSRDRNDQERSSGMDEWDITVVAGALLRCA